MKNQNQNQKQNNIAKIVNGNVHNMHTYADQKNLAVVWTQKVGDQSYSGLATEGAPNHALVNCQGVGLYGAYTDNWRLTIFADKGEVEYTLTDAIGS